MITAIYQDTEVQILETTAVGLAEIITLDGSKPFRIISSSKACEHGAPAIVWLTSGYVDVEELSDIRINGVDALDYMVELFGDRVGMGALKMTSTAP